MLLRISDTPVSTEDASFPRRSEPVLAHRLNDNTYRDSKGRKIIRAEDLASELNVSTKTLDRWYNQESGLERIKFIDVDSSRRALTGYTLDSFNEFKERNPNKIKRANSFSRVGEDEQTLIEKSLVELAHRSEIGRISKEQIKEVAEYFGRSPTTIENIAKNLEHQRSDVSYLNEPQLSLEGYLKLGQRLYRGESTENIVKEFRGGLESSVILLKARYLYLRDAIDSRPPKVSDSSAKEFSSPKHVKSILAESYPEGGRKGRLKAPSDLPRHMQRLYEVPLLTREQEQYLFKRYNLLKVIAAKALDDINPAKVSDSKLARVEKLWHEVDRIRNKVLEANRRLVVSIAKKKISGDFVLDEAISDGEQSLLSSIEKFDYSRGNKFSTYASWAIGNNYNGEYRNRRKRYDRFSQASEDVTRHKEDHRGSELTDLINNEACRQFVVSCFGILDEREQKILFLRFGMGDEEPLTLKEVGERDGVTKERIRQIEARALRKLSDAVKDGRVKIPTDLGGIDLGFELTREARLDGQLSTVQKRVLQKIKENAGLSVGEVKALTSVPDKEPVLLKAVEELQSMGLVFKDRHIYRFVA